MAKLSIVLICTALMGVGVIGCDSRNRPLDNPGVSERDAAEAAARAAREQTQRITNECASATSASTCETAAAQAQTPVIVQQAESPAAGIGQATEIAASPNESDAQILCGNPGDDHSGSASVLRREACQSDPSVPAAELKIDAASDVEIRSLNSIFGADHYALTINQLGMDGVAKMNLS
jgi:hypothetical protein